MDGILLKRSEFLTLLNATRAQVVVGFNSEELFPDETQLRAQVMEGIESLKQRGLLQVENDLHVINADLLAMMTIVSYPQLAAITTRDNPGIGQQLFLHYQAANLAVEQTLPDAATHRLAALPEAAALVPRLQAILPMQAEPGALQTEVILPQAVFMEVKGLAEAGHAQAATQALVQNAMAEPAARLLTDSLQNPTLGGTIALLQCRDEEISDGRQMALVQGPAAAWAITQTEPGAPSLRVATVTAAAVGEQLQQWVKELLSPATP